MVGASGHSSLEVSGVEGGELVAIANDGLCWKLSRWCQRERFGATEMRAKRTANGAISLLNNVFFLGGPTAAMAPFWLSSHGSTCYPGIFSRMLLDRLM